MRTILPPDRTEDMDIPAAAFSLKKDETGFSVFWREFVDNDKDIAIDVIRNLSSNIETALIEANVGKIRAIDSLDVFHDPRPIHESHSEIRGVSRNPRLKYMTIRRRLIRICNWVYIPS